MSPRRPRTPILLLVAACAGAAGGATSPDVVTLSIAGTTDLHGEVFARDGRGGLALLGGYLRNLRAARTADGGAVLLLDSGDTYQGGIESNLSEGALVVAAYGALGVTAAAVGNHDFDFGPVDGPGARQSLGADARGALKARAAQAPYPLLAANLLDAQTGEPVAWPNVRPSVLVEAAGVRVGLIGVMTLGALRATLAANVHGLRVGPLAAAIEEQARALRSAGAEAIVVAAHAGGACSDFARPTDLSSCDPAAEIFAVARSLPAGLVDAILAGHTHDAVAHVVNGIAIAQAYSHGRAFARVDLEIDRRTRRVVGRTPFAPQAVCERSERGSSACAAAPDAPPARYERRSVEPDERVTAAMAPILARVRALRAERLGVVLDTAFERGGAEPALGNLFADALRDATGADVALNNNSRGGLRADLPPGELELGRLYDVFPFDNRVLRVALTARELSAVLAAEAARGRRGALSISGVRARVRCDRGEPAVELVDSGGTPIADEARLTVAAMDSLALGAVFAPVRPATGYAVPEDAPVLREAVEDWLVRRGGRLGASDFVRADAPRWTYEDDASACAR